MSIFRQQMMLQPLLHRTILFDSPLRWRHWRQEPQAILGRQTIWRGRPWTLRQYPMLADWVKEIDVPLNAIAKTINKPIFCPPLLQSPQSEESGTPSNLIYLLLPERQMLRGIARQFQARAAYRISQGNIDGAIDDKLSLHRLGRLTATEPSGILVAYLVSIAMEGTAASIPVNAHPNRPLTVQQVRRILNDLDALPPRTPLSAILEGERLVTLSTVQDFAIAHRQGERAFTGKWEELAKLTSASVGTSPPASPRIPRSFDWNIVNRRINEVYNAMLEPPPRKKFTTMVEAAKKTTAEKSSTESVDVSDMFISLFLPSIDVVEEAVRRTECSDNMQRLILAIQLYRLENGGKMPVENWAMQIGRYLGNNAEELFSCPSNPSPKGSTTYALVQYGSTVPKADETIFLVELTTPVLFDKAVVSVDEVLALFKDREQKLPHRGLRMIAQQNCAVRVLSPTIDEKELSRLLGQSVSK